MRKFKNQPINSDTKISYQAIKRLIPYFTEYKSRVALALICLVLAKVASVFIPFVLKATVDSLDQKTTSDLLYFVATPMALVFAYGAFRLMNVLLGEIRDTIFGRVTERAMRKLGLEIFQHLHQLDLAFHLNRKTGGLARDIERGNTGISFLMRFLVFNIVPTLLEIILVVALLYINYGWQFAAITFLAVSVYITFSAVATEWRTEYVREANKADSSSNSQAIDSLLNFETVKYFNNERYEAGRYDTELAAWEDARRKNRLSLFALNGGQALIISIAMTSMLALSAHNVLAGNMTIGDFVLINSFMFQIFMPLNFLGFVYREIKGSLANIEQMLSLLSKTPNVTDEKDAKALALTHGEVTFKHVDFSYVEDRQILHDLSFTIPAGHKVAIVGASGSGKSTLMKLLFRFYDVSAGEIFFDGQNISQVTQESLRQAIGIVPQDTVLFNDTLYANIRYGRPDASDEEVQQAIDMAHLRHFIERLPEGLETQVGERGLKLSGGEKQRVAIARAILKNAPIMIFDEATSSLDSHAEKVILDAMKSLAEQRTSIVIAHRLSTIVDADLIIVMHEGKIVEQGSHAELIEASGYYEHLWSLQQQEKSEFN